MANNHVINVNFKQKGTGVSSLKTSAKSSIIKIGSKQQSLNPSFQTLKKHPTSNFSLQGFFGKSLALAISGVTVAIANKALDIGMDIYQASTGNQLTVGNIKRVRSYIFRPKEYFVDGIYKYGYLQEKVVSRQNYENNYHRELTGNLIIGNQYGSKR